MAKVMLLHTRPQLPTELVTSIGKASHMPMIEGAEMATVGMTGDTGASTVVTVEGVVNQVAHLAWVTLTGHAARMLPPRRVTLPPTSRAVELSRVMWMSDGSVHEHLVALRPYAAVKVNN